MATQKLTTATNNAIYIHEKRSDYGKQQIPTSENLIDGIFTIPESIDTLALYDKLSERLSQLYAATYPPEESEHINSDYLWMLQALVAEVQGITEELHSRWQVKE